MEVLFEREVGRRLEFFSWTLRTAKKNVELLMQRNFFQAAEFPLAGASMATLDFQNKEHIEILHRC